MKSSSRGALATAFAAAWLAVALGCSGVREAPRTGDEADLREELGIAGRMYVLLQAGRLRAAAEHLDELEEAARRSAEADAVSAFVEERYRYLVDGRRWEEALLAEPVFASGREILTLLHTQGLAAAFRGRADAADNARRVFQQMVDSLRLTRRYRIESHELAAAAAMARGDVAETRSRMEGAVRDEEPWSAGAGPPILPIPARELYGEMLIQLGEAEAAEQELARALEDRPDRPLAVFGRGKAAVLAGDRVRAAAYFRSFLELWQEADPELEAVVEARRFLVEVGG
ncbi:MAG: hypothetical protein V3T72_18905 [Thermoanaerobaculia bacterium]